jgi:hypothetical protein
MYCLSHAWCILLTEPEFVNLLRSPRSITSLTESIPGLLKCLQIRALYAWLRFIATISCIQLGTRPGRFWASVANLCHGENAVFSKWVGHSTTLACPVWEQPDISVKVDRHDSKKPVQERLCKMCITTALVLNSRVLLMYTETGQKLLVYSVKNLWGLKNMTKIWVYDIMTMGLVYPLSEHVDIFPVRLVPTFPLSILRLPYSSHLILHSRLYPCGRNKRQGLDPFSY